MLQGIRDNSQGIIAKVIVGLIVITFALFGVESLVSLSAGSNAPAIVNGEEISEGELYQATQLQRRQILAQMGENADPASLDDSLLTGLVLDSLIEQKALLTTAAGNNMIISDAMVDRIIATTPQFQVDGSFRADQFDAAISNLGFTRQTYRDTVKKDLLIQQQRAGYALSSYALPAQVKQVLSLDRQTRNVSYFAMPIEKVKSLVAVTPAEVKAEFETRKATLKTEEQVEVEYVLLEQSGLASQVSVSEEDVQTEYNQIVAQFESQEQRRAAHILVEVNDDVSDEQALQKIEAIKARIDQGEAFAALAQSSSDDIGSAAAGGDLGVQEIGTFEPAFEGVLFALAEGEVSEPVQSESGYHLITITDIAKTEAPSLETLKQEITQSLIEKKAEQLYIEQLESLTDISFSSADLQEPAEVLGLTIQTMPAFSRASGSTELSRNSKVIREAFSSDVLNEQLNSKTIEIDDKTALVLHLKEHLPVRAKSFAEVEQQLHDEMLQAKAAKTLEARAQEAIALIKASGSAVAAAADFELKSEQDVNRANQSLPLAVVQKAFLLAHPGAGKASVGTAILADQSVAIVMVDKVTKPDLSKITEQELQAVSDLLANQAGQRIYQAFVKQVKDSAEIERL